MKRPTWKPERCAYWGEDRRYARIAIWTQRGKGFGKRAIVGRHYQKARTPAHGTCPYGLFGARSRAWFPGTKGWSVFSCFSGQLYGPFSKRWIAKLEALKILTKEWETARKARLREDV
jgi:hypothetical protein